MSKAIVLLSGGIDSATALWLVKQRYKVYALSFKLHERNRNEISAAKKLSEKANVEKHLIVDVGFLKEISELPQLRKNPILDKINLPPTYIPSRNTVFFGVASYFSEIIGAKYIVTGHSHIDPFPDSKPRYVRAINAALSYGSWLGKGYKTRIIMPLVEMDKKGIVELALRLGVPLELTWSCHEDGAKACGKCDGCISRLKAFEDLSIRDKIEYEPS
ncbi:MAG: 7-cyano-7-deazaguanine synthase QueC [Crenarchaeota archaeon]|nr:7-cyano-7-deazaguanine synthase QueC [Thermoproteota archaeon]